MNFVVGPDLGGSKGKIRPGTGKREKPGLWGEGP